MEHQSNDNVSEEVMASIKQAGRRPISATIFYLRRIAFWSGVALALLGGSMALASIIFFGLNSDWDLYRRLGLGFVVETMPYFWLFCFALFVFFGEYYYRRTSFGYRYRLVYIIGAYLILTTLGGLLLHFSGANSYWEKILAPVAAYPHAMARRQLIWYRPNDGLLVGKILSQEEFVDKKIINLADPRQQIWQVDYSQARLADDLQLGENSLVKIIGTALPDRQFMAEEIRPWWRGDGKRGPNPTLFQGENLQPMPRPYLVR